MALYRQAGSKYWWISLYRPNQPRLRISTHKEDRAEAEAVEAVFRLAVRGKSPQRDRLHQALDSLLGHDPATAGGLTLGNLWSTYSVLPEVEIAPTTRRHRQVNVQRFIRWAAKARPLVVLVTQVTPQDAQAFADYLRAGGMGGKTWNNIRGDLRRVWAQVAVRAGCTSNPWDLVLPWKANSRHGRAFSREEEELILTSAEKLHPEWAGACVVARWTGLRLGDVLGLTRDHFSDGLLRLKPSKTARHGIKATIPVHPRLASWLAAWPHAPALFPWFATRRDSSAAKLEFGQILRTAGVASTAEGQVSFHSWRHTFRTRLAEAGVSNDVARKLGGWTTDVAERVYDHDLTQLQRAIAAMK
jgi:integrase